MTDDPELPLRRLLDAVTSVGGELDLDRVLREVVRAAVSLVRARYGALGVLDPDRTYLSDFVSVGIDDDTADVIGELPKGHGILGLLIEDPRPIRLADLGGHPDRFGFPPGHPPMTSFLGVPVFVGGAAYGNLYLTDKADGGLFTDQDEELVVSLAAAAGTAIERARLHRRLRALDLVEDRERIARDLHDTVIQRLFATGLALQGAARLAAPLPEVEQRIQQAVDDLDQVVRQIRSTIFELHAAASATGGVRRRLLRVADDLVAALGFAPSFRFDGPVDIRVDDDLAEDLAAVLGEGLTNVARHARARRAEVIVGVGDRLVATIDDDGDGPGPARPEGHGLANLAARAEARGGTLEVLERPGGGTRLRWSVPLA